MNQNDQLRESNRRSQRMIDTIARLLTGSRDVLRLRTGTRAPKEGVVPGLHLLRHSERLTIVFVLAWAEVKHHFPDEHDAQAFRHKLARAVLKTNGHVDVEALKDAALQDAALGPVRTEQG